MQIRSPAPARAPVQRADTTATTLRHAAPRPAADTVVDPSYGETFAPAILLCQLVSAKPFLGGAILRVNSNGTARAYRLGRDLAAATRALAITAGSCLRLDLRRGPDGAECGAGLDLLAVR